MSAQTFDVQIVEMVGEGVADVTRVPDTVPVLPEKGVVTILLHRLCGSPITMRVKRNNFQSLIGKGLMQKAKFFKRNARTCCFE